jgi:hypothetical protein
LAGRSQVGGCAGTLARLLKFAGSNLPLPLYLLLLLAFNNLSFVLFPGPHTLPHHRHSVGNVATICVVHADQELLLVADN